MQVYVLLFESRSVYKIGSGAAVLGVYSTKEKAFAVAQADVGSAVLTWDSDEADGSDFTYSVDTREVE